MSDAILIINAGSSSIKFSVFVADTGGLALTFRGQIEGLFTSPHFVARKANGALMSENSWGEGVKLGHEGAIEYLHGFLREHRGELRLVGLAPRRSRRR